MIVVNKELICLNLQQTLGLNIKKLCLQAYEGVLCGSCREGYGKGPSMTCETCPSWFILLLRLAAAAIQLIVTALLFIKGAKDYAKDVLSSGMLQRRQTLNAKSIKDYHRGESLDCIRQQPNPRLQDVDHAVSDPTDILKVCITEAC